MNINELKNLAQIHNLSIDSHVDFRSGEEHFTVCDNVGALYSSIFLTKIELFIKRCRA